MADVFISYKREERAWAERVDAAVRAAGYSTWFDTSLVAGEHFNAAIERELQAASCVIVLWSEGAKASRWVNAEAVSGFDRDILVGARVDDVALGYPFSVVQTTDLRGRDGMAQLVEGVRGKCGAIVATAAAGSEEVAHTNRVATKPPQARSSTTAEIASVAQMIGGALIIVCVLLPITSTVVFWNEERDLEQALVACIAFGYPLLALPGAIGLAYGRGETARLGPFLVSAVPVGVTIVLGAAFGLFVIEAQSELLVGALACLPPPIIAGWLGAQSGARLRQAGR